MSLHHFQKLETEKAVSSVSSYYLIRLTMTLREEHRLRVFENRVLRRIFGLKRDEVTGGGENCITRSFVIYTLRRV
jgi:hypothetical protein